MSTYTVKDYRIGIMEQSVEVTIELKQLVSQHLLSTYLPSLCILIIAQVVFLHFEDEKNTIMGMSVIYAQGWGLTENARGTHKVQSRRPDTTQITLTPWRLH